MGVILGGMAIGGMAAVLVAMLAALTVLPAVLSVMGDKLHKPGRVPGVKPLRRFVRALSPSLKRLPGSLNRTLPVLDQLAGWARQNLPSGQCAPGA